MGEMKSDSEFTEKVRSTIEQLSQEARGNGDDASRALKAVLAEKSAELSGVREAVKAKIEKVAGESPGASEFLAEARQRLDALIQEANTRGGNMKGSLQQVISEKHGELEGVMEKLKEKAGGVAGGLAAKLGEAKSSIEEKLGHKTP